MATVDNRIVHMTFDNAQFERNMAQTMASMEQLKKSLDFSAAKNNFAQLEQASNSLHLGGIATAVEGIASKFTALGATAFSVIANITSRVLDAGIQMAKSFTVSPILDGFREMETNMNSIQTILANTSSKGSTLDDVNGALNQLNEYSDQTIYNFSQMAKNIGTFTAAGVDLDTSVGAIKGIANVAAISGSNAEQASNAMYQLSQALASGSVKLMDWNSIVNAGMGGEVFQKALFETGKSLGTLQDVGLDTTFDDWKKAGNTFRTSLEDGWLTADVLTNTLNAFTGDLSTAQLTALGYTEEQAAEMLKLGALGKAAATEVKTLTQLMGTVKESVGSGWSKTFQIVFGDFEEAKELFTSLSNVIGGFVGKSADRRNELLQGWKDLGGRTVLLKGLADGFKGLGRILIAVRGAFQTVFPPVTAKQLFDLTQKFADFLKRLAPAPNTLDKLREIFVGVFSAVRIGIEIIAQIARVFKTLFTEFAGGSSGQILDFFVNISEKVQDLKKILVDDGGIQKFFDGLLGFFQDPLPAIQNFITQLKSGFEQIWEILAFGGFSGGVLEEDSWIVDKLFDFRELVVDTITGFVEDFKGAIQEVMNVLSFGDFKGTGPWEEDSPIVSGLLKFRELLTNIFGDFQIPEGLVNFFKGFGENVDENTTNSLSGGFERLRGVLETFWDVLKKIFDVLGEIADRVIWVAEKFWDFVTSIDDAIGAIFDFAKNIGPNLQKAFESEAFDKFLDFLTSVGVLLGGAGIANMSKNGLKVDVTGGALTQLAEVFKQMSGKNGLIDQVKKSFEGLTDTMGAMQTKIKADAIQKIAIAIAILTASLLVLSMIEPEALAKALAAMATGFGELVGTMALMDKIGGGGKESGAKLAMLAGSMILLAGAALVLSGAVTVLGRMDMEELGKGLAAIAALLTMLVGVAKLMQANTASLIGAGLGMIGIATALTILAGAVMLFATLSWEELGKGFAAIAVGLGLITAAVNLMPASTILIGPGLMAVATAMAILAGAVMLFATMSWKELGKGFAAVAGGLLIIAGAMHLMPTTTILTGPGLMAVATGLTILGGALKIFASMSWEEIGKAMAVLGSSLLILSIGLTLMSGTMLGSVAVGVAAVSLLLLGKALKEFAKMSWKDLGKGLGVMAAALGALGLAALALSATGAIAAIFLLGVALVALGVGFALIGLGASLLAEAFQIIAAAGTAGIDTLMYAIDELLKRLPEMVTQFVAGFIDGFDLLLGMLPSLIDKLSGILASLLDMLIELVPKFIELASMYIGAFLEVIRNSSPDLIKTGIQIVMDFLKGIRDNVQEMVQVGLDILENFIKGLVEGTPGFVNEIINLVTTFISELAKRWGDLAQAGTDMLVAFLGGITDNLEEITDAVGELVEKFAEEVGDLAEDFATAGIKALIAFLEGLAEDIPELAKNIGLMVTNIMDALADEFVAAADRAAQIIIDFLNDLAAVIRENDDKLHDAFMNLGKAMIEGLVTVLLGPELIKMAEDAAVKIVKKAYNAAKDWLLPGSPSRRWAELGVLSATGFAKGLNDDTTAEKSSAGLATRATNSFQKALEEASNTMQYSDEFNPTITPVLDLTKVQTEAGRLNGILSTQPLTANASLDAANNLSVETLQAMQDISPDTTPRTPTEVKFEQNNYSPESLNTARIYKQTRNLIVLTKEELKIA